MGTNALYIGKLAPMHRGHEEILRRALYENDRLCVFIYNSVEFDEANPQLDKVIRGYWVKNAYPDADVRVGYNPPADDYTPLPDGGYVGDKQHADYVFRHMPYHIDRVYGGEPWVMTIAQHIGAEGVLLDRDGKGISATKIRQNPRKYAWYMRPEIRDWMILHYGYGSDEGLVI